MLVQSRAWRATSTTASCRTPRIARGRCRQGPWFMTQSWHHLLFAHWAVPPSLIASTASAGPRARSVRGTRVDRRRPVLDEQRHAARRAAAAWVSTFAELNVRTYVTVGGTQAGRVLLQPRRDNPLAVAVARAVLQSALLLGVDAHTAERGRGGAVISYECDRRREPRAARAVRREVLAGGITASRRSQERSTTSSPSGIASTRRARGSRSRWTSITGRGRCSGRKRKSA